jgi:hypothetical protein
LRHVLTMSEKGESNCPSNALGEETT